MYLHKLRMKLGFFIHFIALRHLSFSWVCVELDSDDAPSFIGFISLFVPICTEYLETPSRSDTEVNFRQHRNPQGQRHPEELENDCSIAKQRCREDPYCFLVYKSFQRACQADAVKCRLPLVNQECLSAWKELKKTVLGECKCSDPLQMRCIKIWKGLFNNPCLQYSQENQASAASENDDDGNDDDYVDDEKNQDTDTG